MIVIFSANLTDFSLCDTFFGVVQAFRLDYNFKDNFR